MGFAFNIKDSLESEMTFNDLLNEGLKAVHDVRLNKKSDDELRSMLTFCASGKPHNMRTTLDFDPDILDFSWNPCRVYGNSGCVVVELVVAPR